jgi:hypothetical protein
MVDMTVITTFIPFLYIFGAGFRFASRTAAGCGLAVTLLAILLSAMPPPEASSVVVFEVKVLGGTLLVALCGWLLFKRFEAERSKGMVGERPIARDESRRAS